MECDVGMLSKIPPVQSYIQPRRHKALQIKRHKLLTDRCQTYVLLRTWLSCADRNCQDNINTEIEIQRRWHTVLQVKCLVIDCSQLILHLLWSICVLCQMWSFREFTVTDVQTAAKVHTEQVDCSELLTDRGTTCKVRSDYSWNGQISKFRNVNPTVSRTELHFLGFCSLRMPWRLTGPTREVWKKRALLWVGLGGGG